MIKSKISILIFLLISIKCFSQTIPVSRIADWSHVGYPDSIPNSNNILNVMQFGATGDGATDDVNAIRSAIDSLHGMRGVIYFPPGNYLIGSSIDIPDSTILRGASSDSTHLIFNFNGVIGNGFNITGSIGGTFTDVVAKADRNSSSIVVSNPTSFNAGDFAELVEDNGSWDTDPVFWANNSVGQILHLTRVSSDTLFFDSPLRINYDASLHVRIQKIIPALEVGIECMKISREDNVATDVCYNIFYNYAANSWIRGVESSLSVGSHVEIDASTNISIRGNYFHHSFLYDGASTHGYGITLFAHSGQCLIENNIMQHLRHSFSLQTGANGNVIAYNFSTDPNSSEPLSNASADVSLHGHYPFSNLFEGNIVQNIQIDQAHGPNGPFNTFFRNRADLYGFIMSSGTVQNDSMNIVGNEVTNTGFLMGNYILAGSGHFEFGNNIKGTLTPPSTAPLPDSSYYLNGYPSFWTTFNFPTIGIPNTISSGSIPAKDRFLSGVNLTSCNDDITIGIESFEESLFNIFPNPASSYLKISNPLTSEGYNLILKDLNGKIVLQNSFKGINQENILSIPENISNGIYLLEINSNRNKIYKKISIVR